MRTALFALVFAACLTGCGKPASDAGQWLDSARQAREAGQLNVATDHLRAAIRLAPDDSSLRLELADLHLQAGDPASALAAFRRAEQMGVHPGRLQVGRAQGSASLQRWPDVLTYTESRDDLPAADRFELLYLRGLALLHTDNANAANIRATFVSAFALIDSNPLALDAKDARQRIVEKRGAWPAVEAAWQHYSCGAQTPVPDQGNGAHADRRVLQVGPNRPLRTPSAAARVARDGDVIAIDAALYNGDVAVWPQNDLLLIGVGGRPQLHSGGRVADDKGIWYITGNNATVDNVEFSGARAKGRNGSGIRMYGKGLTVRNSYFHHNENGILVRGDDASDVVVKNSEFAHNGYGDGFSHNLYIGRVRSFVMEGSYSHEARRGHLVKSRAAHTVIRYNRLMDEDTGNSSYLIDVPEGGTAYIIGNEMMQSHLAENPAVISFGAEVEGKTATALYVVNNTLYNRQHNGIFVHNHTTTSALVANNLLAGAPVSILKGTGTLDSNLMRPGLALASVQNYDFRLLSTSPAIDTGAALDGLADGQLVAKAEYDAVSGMVWRQKVWTIDVGAREYCAATAPPAP